MDNDEKLIQYIDGELTGTERDAIEQTLRQDAVLRQQRDNLLLARDAVKLYGLKAQVASVHYAMMEELSDAEQLETKPRYPFVRNFMKIAASLFIAFCLFGTYEYTNLSSKELYSDNYSAYKAAVNRGGTQVMAIEKAFNTGDKKAVIEQFEQSDQPTVKERFLAAQAYLSLRQPTKAATQFNGVLQSGDDTFKDDTEYYLALSYLDEDQPALAKPILEKIYDDPDHLYHERVTWFFLLKLAILTKKTGR